MKRADLLILFTFEHHCVFSYHLSRLFMYANCSDAIQNIRNFVHV